MANQARQKMCFVIMPFIPELHYFYLYLKQYIEGNYSITCERADAQVLTKPILEKINEYIQSADLIIADCSGRNPNVMYELGIAHAYGKDVILITHDDINDAPSDIRHYEFIKYDLSNHVQFLNRLDNALRNVIIETYESLYQRALEVFEDFRNQARLQITAASRDVFLNRVMAAERTGRIPSIEDDEVVAFVLPRIIADSNDVTMMDRIVSWLNEKSS